LATVFQSEGVARPWVFTGSSYARATKRRRQWATVAQVYSGDAMFVFGKLPDPVRELLSALRAETAGLAVGRRSPRRSDTPFPTSGDLERELVPFLDRKGFKHHVNLRHPRTRERFEYDFFHTDFGIAVEVMGYRADDEVYKDILKFHVHDATRVGVVWVPRWKWISKKSTDTNFRAALKALAFTDSFMCVEALVAFAYDWQQGEYDCWRLQHIDASNESAKLEDRRAGIRNMSRLTQEAGGYDTEPSATSALPDNDAEGV
jgi:hypothetical protein